MPGEPPGRKGPAFWPPRPPCAKNPTEGVHSGKSRDGQDSLLRPHTLRRVPGSALVLSPHRTGAGQTRPRPHTDAHVPGTCPGRALCMGTRRWSAPSRGPGSAPTCPNNHDRPPSPKSGATGRCSVSHGNDQAQKMTSLGVCTGEPDGDQLLVPRRHLRSLSELSTQDSTGDGAGCRDMDAPPVQRG